MATVTTTVGGSSNNDNGAAPDAKGRGAEVIGVDGTNKDCGADAGSSSTADLLTEAAMGWSQWSWLVPMRAAAKTPLPQQPSTAGAVDGGRHHRP